MATSGEGEGGTGVVTPQERLQERLAKPVGLFELYRALKDSEIQARVPLVHNGAKSYGRGLGG